MDTPEIRAALSARVIDEDMVTRGEALRGLALRHDERALEPLIAELDVMCAKDADNRLGDDTLLEAAFYLGNPRLLPVLLHMQDEMSVAVMTVPLNTVLMRASPAKVEHLLHSVQAEFAGELHSYGIEVADEIQDM